MTDVRVKQLEPSDAGVAGVVLAASHHNYPAFRLQFPDPRVRHRVLLPFQTAAARDVAIYGSLLGAYVDDHLVGVALWQPPGRFPLSPSRKARMTPALLRAALAAPRAFPRFARSGAALERTFPDEPVWYLETLGIHPNAQRRGVGSALLADGLAIVDADHVACHLHTSDEANLAYYRRWGFELTFPAFPAGPGGPTYYGMTRPRNLGTGRRSSPNAE
jgi:ribosomal protein S18 acetylase RimI-like enzyme